MSIKLFDSELKVMQILWKKGDMPAADIAAELEMEIGWNKNTTYTVIKKCIKKGAIERRDPRFICHATVDKQEIKQSEATELMEKIFDGPADMLFASLSGKKAISPDEIEKLKKLIDELDEK